MIQTKIDWITITTKERLIPLWGETFGERVRGVSNYDFGYITPTGRYYFGSKEQGNMSVFSGENLDNIRKYHDASELDIAQICSKFKCTRIDIALDAYGYGITSKMLEKWAIDGIIKPRSKTFTLISDSLGVRGDTFYIGSRKSVSKLFRGYEKSKQQNDFLERFRMELQIGGDGGSMNALTSLASNESVDSISKEMQSVIGGYLNHTGESEILKDVLGREITKYKGIDKHKNDTRKWLETMVLPVLKREMLADESFHESVVKFLNE